MSNTIFICLSNYEDNTTRLFRVSEEHRLKILNFLHTAVRKEALTNVTIQEVGKGKQINCTFRTVYDMKFFVSHFSNVLEEVLSPHSYERIITFSVNSSTGVPAKSYTFNKTWRVQIFMALLSLQDCSEGEGSMYIMINENPNGTITCQFETEHDLRVAEQELAQYLNKD